MTDPTAKFLSGLIHSITLRRQSFETTPKGLLPTLQCLGLTS
jgi:hypothetical protein